MTPSVLNFDEQNIYFKGIPTSRAASLAVSDDLITRDQFYDGNPQQEKTAVVLRLAQSWFRFGSLEILSKDKEINLLRRVVDFIIEHYFRHIDINSHDRVLALFNNIVDSTAKMIALWQSVGFTHGVCNTDNFSILSITIDFGPFGFLEQYNPEFVPNTSDDEARYSYEKQPDVGIYNLDKLAKALLPLLSAKQHKQLNFILKGYVDIYKNEYMRLFLKKLGLALSENDKESDEQLIAILLKIMEDAHTDFTMTFRQLSEYNLR